MRRVPVPEDRAGRPQAAGGDGTQVIHLTCENCTCFECDENTPVCCNHRSHVWHCSSLPLGIRGGRVHVLLYVECVILDCPKGKTT